MSKSGAIVPRAKESRDYFLSCSLILQKLLHHQRPLYYYNLIHESLHQPLRGTSCAIAHAFEKCPRRVIQATEPWISTDIDTGSRWESEIADNHEQRGSALCV